LPFDTSEVTSADHAGAINVVSAAWSDGHSMTAWIFSYGLISTGDPPADGCYAHALVHVR
jgi:hypothetical protein